MKNDQNCTDRSFDHMLVKLLQVTSRALPICTRIPGSFVSFKLTASLLKLTYEKGSSKLAIYDNFRYVRMTLGFYCRVIGTFAVFSKETLNYSSRTPTHSKSFSTSKRLFYDFLSILIFCGFGIFDDLWLYT